MKSIQHPKVTLTQCRTPHGVRGLKFDAQAVRDGKYKVAPRTGCVD